MWVQMLLDARRGHHIFLELKTAGSHLTWMLGTKLWSSAGAGWALKLGVISLACWSWVLKNKCELARSGRQGMTVQRGIGRIVMLFTCHCCCHLIIVLAIIIITTPSPFVLIPTLIGVFMLAHGIMVQQRRKYQKGKSRVYRMERLIWCRVGCISVGVVLGLCIELTLSWEICVTARHQDG